MSKDNFAGFGHYEPRSSLPSGQLQNETWTCGVCKVKRPKQNHSKDCPFSNRS